jgi:hypothetical protein
MKRSEIEPAFPELARSGGYGEYLKINSAMGPSARHRRRAGRGRGAGRLRTAPEFPLNQVLYGPPARAKPSTR